VVWKVVKSAQRAGPLSSEFRQATRHRACGAPAPRRSSGAPPELAGPVTPSQEGWFTSRTWKGRGRAGEHRAAHRRRPAGRWRLLSSTIDRCAETRRGAASGGGDDSSSGAGSREERPGLLQARADGARRGALSGGGVRHMLMQISPLGDLVRQVIWGLCRAASRGAPGRRTSGAKSKYSEIPPAFV